MKRFRLLIAAAVFGLVTTACSSDLVGPNPTGPNFDETERLSRKVLCHDEQVYYVIRPRAEISTRSITSSPCIIQADSTRFDTTQEWFGTTRTRSPGFSA